MSSCCSSPSETKPKISKLDCPSCGKKCLHVSFKTMQHHIKQPWSYPFSEEQYYYCGNPGCDAVYFSATNKIIHVSEIRPPSKDEDLICFCFGITRSDSTINKGLKDFVVEKTKSSMCSCEMVNPSGRCCLKDFPK